MGSFFGAMTGFVGLLGVGYLVLTVFLIVYFFRMANDVKELKDSLDTIKKILVKKDWKEKAQEEERK